MNPEVPWRFRERYLTTDFIQSHNVAVEECALKLSKAAQETKGDKTLHDRCVEVVAEWIRAKFEYPLDTGGNPSAGGQLMRHKKNPFSFLFARSNAYMWALPNEVLESKLGICIDTANLATSVLRAMQIPAMTVLGDLRSCANDCLIGRHAWTEVTYLGERYIIETTIHQKSVDNLVPCAEAYKRDSTWCVARKLFYQVQAKYDETQYIGEGPLGYEIPMLLGLSNRRAFEAMLPGSHTLEEVIRNPKDNYREWQREEKFAVRILEQAYKIKA